MHIHLLGYTGSIQHQEAGNVSLAVTDGNTSILIDVSGAPVMALKQAGIDARDLSLVMLTHSHIDHIYALPSLLHQLWLLGRTDALVIVGNGSTLSKAKELCAVFALEHKSGMFPLVWEVLEEGPYLGPLGRLRLSVFPVSHGVPTLGVSVVTGDSKFVYLADCTADFAYPALAYDAALLIHEAGGTKEEESVLTGKGHSSARQAAMDARTLRSGRLVFCHLPPDPSLYQKMLDEANSVFERTELPVLHETYEV